MHFHPFILGKVYCMMIIIMYIFEANREESLNDIKIVQKRSITNYRPAIHVILQVANILTIYCFM